MRFYPVQSHVMCYRLLYAIEGGPDLTITVQGEEYFSAAHRGTEISPHRAKSSCVDREGTVWSLTLEVGLKLVLQGDHGQEYSIFQYHPSVGKVQSLFGGQMLSPGGPVQCRD